MSHQFFKGTLKECPHGDKALTHRSWAGEHKPSGMRMSPEMHNERLEHLGDAVLQLYVTERIFKEHQGLAEGEMAKLRSGVVSTKALAEFARVVGLGSLIKLGHGERSSGGHDKDSILADTFEACIAAFYLHGGMKLVGEMLRQLIDERIRVVQQGPVTDPKTRLQEVAVKKYGSPPKYTTCSEGPEHARTFESSIYVNGVKTAIGRGSSKKAAESDGALKALAKL